MYYEYLRRNLAERERERIFTNLSTLEFAMIISEHHSISFSLMHGCITFNNVRLSCLACKTMRYSLDFLLIACIILISVLSVLIYVKTFFYKKKLYSHVLKDIMVDVKTSFCKLNLC